LIDFFKIEQCDGREKLEEAGLPVNLLLSILPIQLFKRWRLGNKDSFT